MVSSSPYISKAAVFADLRPAFYSVQLNVFERMTKSTPSSIANSSVTLDFYYGNFCYLLLRIASEQSEVRLKEA